MIYTIHQSRISDDTVLVCEEPFDAFAMLEAAGLHKNAYVGCWHNYEDCLILCAENFRDTK